MRYLTSVTLALIMSVGLADAPLHAEKPGDTRDTLEMGKAIYQRTCLMCHGRQGKGDGPAAWYLGRYSAPRPRDFTAESFRSRTTPTGELPADQDLFRVVTQGIPGYMPPFASLTEEERWQVIAYVQSLRPEFREEARNPIIIGFPPFPPSESSITHGRTSYQRLGCQTCHGLNGTGDGPVSRTGELKNERGLHMRATDLTDRSSFKFGARPQDIYRALMTGLDGTPMPSYADYLRDKEAEAWDLVYYVLSLSSERRE